MSAARRLVAYALLGMALAACAPSAPPAPQAEGELWIANARLWDAVGPWALRIAEGRVAERRPGGDVPRTAAPVLDARGGLVLPGFHDAHVHVRSGGETLGRLRLAEAGSVDEIVRALRRHAAEHPAEEWLLGRGWPYDAFPEGERPHRRTLDAAAPGRAVALESYDGHALWVSSRALALAGVGPETPDPPDGTIVREPGSRRPSGLLLDGASALVEETLPAPSAAERRGTLERALRHLVALGVTSVDDFARDPAVLADYAALEAAGRLPLRVRVGLPLEGDLDHYEALRRRHDSPRLRVGYLKAFVDGVVEARTAYLLEPYAGAEESEPAERGRPLIARDRLVELVTDAQRRNFPVALHAIGDAAVRLALDAIAAAQRAAPRWGLYPRIEHIEVVHPADLPRFADLGVVASMQPFHANPLGPQPDAGVWSRNLGAARLRRSFAWRDLRDAGAPLVFGSDWPVMTADPLQGLAVATTRRDAEGRPEEGWNAHQALSPDEALAAYAGTIGVGGLPQRGNGRVLEGMPADLVLLFPGVDPAEPETLWRGERVRAVLVGGEVAYAAEADRG